MKQVRNQIYIVLIAISLFSGNLLSQTTNYEAKGNLESHRPLDCIELDNVTNMQTPADIVRGVNKCLKKNQHTKAAKLYGLASAYGQFDTLRVKDKTAHQAMGALSLTAFMGVNDDSVKELTDTLKSQFSVGSAAHSQNCNTIAQIGAPQYHPTYMIQHGIKAFINSDEDDGIATDFNAEEAWAQTLEQYLHC